jgi:hypothetical protein
LIYLYILGFIALLWALGQKRLGSTILPYTLTFRELIITVCCSFFPIILDSIIQGWFTPIKSIDAFFTSFENGQAFLYTSAYLSAFFVFYIKDNNKPPGFILGIVFYSGFAGALLYTFAYSTKVLQLQSYAPNEVISVIEVSIVLCVFIAWYWSTLPSNKNRSSATREVQQQLIDLETKYKTAKGA